MCDIYIDDFFCFCRWEMLPVVRRVVLGCLDLCGFTYKPEKVADSFDDGLLPLLGLRLNFSKGVPDLSVDPARVAALSADISCILRADALSPGDASKLCGKLAFAFSSVADRRLNPLLRPIYERVYAPGRGCGLTPSMRLSLRSVLSVLGKLPPRSLTSYKPSFRIYTDASFARGRGIIAAVLIDARAGVVHDWGRGSLSCWFCKVRAEDLPESVRAFPINFLELITPVVALRIWKATLAGAQVAFYVDNTAAEHTLLNMNSKKPHFALPTFQFWAELTSAGIDAWVDRVATDCNIADWPTRNNLRGRLHDFWNFSGVAQVFPSQYGIAEILSLADPLINSFMETPDA